MRTFDGLRLDVPSRIAEHLLTPERHEPASGVLVCLMRPQP